MKKLIVATCLMVSAVFASFAGVQVNNLGPGIESWSASWSLSFTFTSDGSYSLEFGSPVLLSGANYSVYDFGYYYMDNPTIWYSGTLTGNNSDYFSLVGQPGYPLEDINTGYLGDFKAGDTIGIWVKYNYYFPQTHTTTDAELGNIYAAWDQGLYIQLGSLLHFHFVETNAPAGEPLPGVLAALSIGGCAFLGRKIRKSIKK